MIRDYSTSENEQFMAQLLDEIPLADLEGQQMFVSKVFKREYTGKVDEGVIAEARRLLKVSFFLYKRKRARW
jgi:hypothetical protein